MTISDQQNMTSQHLDLKLEISDKSLAALVLIWCLGTLVHLAYRVLVFRLIDKKGSLKDNPINLLILVDEIQWMAQLVHQPLMFYILYARDVKNLHGQFGCLLLHIFVLLGIFSIFQFVFGGLAITCLRFLFIRAYMTVLKIGQWTLTVPILAMSQLIIFSMTIAYAYNRERHWDIDFCWDGLENIRVLDPPRSTIYLLPLGCLLETSLHLYLSYFLYQQDKQVKHMIMAESYRRRNMKNAIDLAGQMVRFFFEILVVVFSLIGSHRPSAGTAVECMSLTVIVGSGLIPAYHIYVSDILQEEFFNILSNLFRS